MRRRDERGQMTLQVIMLMLSMFVVAGFVIDVGRWLVARDALESATEAASLAAAQTGQHMAEVWVTYKTNDFVRWKTVCDKRDDKGKCTQSHREPVCTWHLHQHVHFGPLEESQILPNGWQNLVPRGTCPQGPTLEFVGQQPEKQHRFLQFPGDVQSAALQAFQANLEPLARVGAQVGTPLVTPHGSESDPAYPSVTVRAFAQVPSWFAQFFGMRSFPASRCSQSLVTGYPGQHQGECGLRARTSNADTATGWQNPNGENWAWK